MLDIARAFLHQRKIWVLDEATSYNKENLQKCDGIFVLDKGNIVKNGTFDELVESWGQFRQLYELGNQKTIFRGMEI